MENINIIYSTFLLQIKHSLSRQTYRFCLLIQPIIYTIMSYTMFKNSGQADFVTFIVLGTGLLSLWSCICFSSAGDIERERYMGTLQIIFNLPIDFKVIVFSKILANTVLGLIPLCVSFIFVKLFYNVDIKIVELKLFIFCLIISIISFVAISLIFSAIFTLSRNSRILMNCIEYPIYILCGVLFPINILPVWIRMFSYLLTPTYAINLLRMSALGVENKIYFYKNLLLLFILSLIYLIIAYILFKYINKKVRINATLEVS